MLIINHNSSGDIMKEKNELLMHIYETCDMGVKSTTKLIDLLRDKDNKIKKLLEDELKEYEKFLVKSEKLLKKNKVEPEGAGMMAEMMAKMSMKMDVKKDNSDSNIAGILTEGFTMGIINMNKKIEAYRDDCDNSIIDLATDIVKFQEKEIKNLKCYL
jgi:uncharacterized protein (DUF305 family)